MSSETELPLLILDLDETLVHTVEKPLDRECDFRVDELYVYKRPHVDQFLKEVQTAYRLAVWSAGSEDYVVPTITRLVLPITKPVFIWSRYRCTRRYDWQTGEEVNVKYLKKVKKRGYDLRRVLIVEDTPANVRNSYGNAVYVTAWEGQDGDDELLKLSRYLLKLASEPDFRKVEKRFWRREASA